MASTQKPGTNVQDLLPDEVIRHIPLTDILVDYDWNGRSKKNVLSDASDGVQDTTIRAEHQTLGTGLKGMRLTLRNRGQDTPVIVRRVDNGKSLGGKKTDRPYELVAGFRRYTAIEQLNASAEDREFIKTMNQKTLIPNTADGTVMAVVRTLNPLEARILNGRENTDRQSLTTQEMLGVVAELSRAKLTQAQIATELSISQGYVSKLSKIGELPKAVLDHWKGEAKLPGLPPAVSEQLTSTEMIELRDMTKELTEGQTVKRYIELLSPAEGGTEGDPNAADPVEAKVKRAAELAAGLVKAGVLDNGSLQWAAVIGPKKDGFLIDSGKADAVQRAKYWDLAEKAFGEAMAAQPKAPKAAKGAAAEASAEAATGN
jgi:ParB-like chromosome segregation protein Spo0J